LAITSVTLSCAPAVRAAYAAPVADTSVDSDGLDGDGVELASAPQPAMAKDENAQNIAFANLGIWVSFRGSRENSTNRQGGA
jgi:hypothetical protein